MLCRSDFVGCTVTRSAVLLGNIRNESCAVFCVGSLPNFSSHIFIFFMVSETGSLITNPSIQNQDVHHKRDDECHLHYNMLISTWPTTHTFIWPSHQPEAHGRQLSTVESTVPPLPPRTTTIGLCGWLHSMSTVDHHPSFRRRPHSSSESGISAMNPAGSNGVECSSILSVRRSARSCSLLHNLSRSLDFTGTYVYI